MNTAVKKRNIGPELKAFIVHSVKELLEDPDFGLELTERAKKRLRAAKSREQKWTPLAGIAKKYR